MSSYSHWCRKRLPLQHPLLQRLHNTPQLFPNACSRPKKKDISYIKGFRMIEWEQSDTQLAHQLCERNSLTKLLKMANCAVFKRTIEFRPNLKLPLKKQWDDERQIEVLKPIPTKTTARDLVILLSAIGMKHPRTFSEFIPMCEVLTALINDLSIPELLQLFNVLSDMRLHHQALGEAIADTLHKKLLKDRNNTIIHNLQKKSDTVPCADDLLYVLILSCRIYRGLATQRINYCKIIPFLRELLTKSLRIIKWKFLSDRECQIGSRCLSWIANDLGKLDYLGSYHTLPPLLNEHLKALAKLGHVNIASYALWGEALFLCELDKLEVYRKALLEIAVRMSPILKDISLSCFMDYASEQERYGRFRQLSKYRIGRDTHRRLSSIIFGLRYFHHDDYELLPDSVRLPLERIQNFTLPPEHPNRLKIKENIKYVLKRLRIAHYENVMRGPVMTDIMERDRNCIWSCGTSSSFYANTREHRFRQRLLQAMGYNVASFAFWQYGRLRTLRARLEYVRMARYYALRDRREFDPEFEGWSLPYLDLVSRKAYNVQQRGAYFPNSQPLGYKEY